MLPVNVNPTAASKALGETICYEWFLGDYALALNLAQEALEEAHKGVNPAAVADALLELGIVRLLRGETPAAWDCLQQVEKTVPEDPNHLLRAASYANYLIVWHYDLFPNMANAVGIEISRRWDKMNEIKAINDRINKIMVKASQQEAKNEAWFVLNLLIPIPMYRDLFKICRYSPSDNEFLELISNSYTPSLTGFQSFVETQGGTAEALAFIDLACADISWRANIIQRRDEHFQKAYASYQRCNSLGGQAICRMAQGDWFAVKFSTPPVLNFAIEDTNFSDNSNLTDNIETAEAGMQGADLAGALTAYREAENLFEHINAQRGLGQIYLRYAFLAWIQEDYNAALGHARRAAEIFHRSGDLLGFWLAETHRMIFQVSAGYFPEDLQTAEALGKWGAEQGSFSHVLGLGILLCRAARHWLIRMGDFERSLACYRLAERLFRSLGAVANWGKSIVDQGRIYSLIGEKRSALILYEKARLIWEQDLEKGLPKSESIRASLLFLDQEITNLYIQSMNPDGIKRSVDRTKRRIRGFIPILKTATNDPEAALSQELTQLIISFGNSSNIEYARVLVPLYRGVQARDAGDKEGADQFFNQAERAALKVNKVYRGLMLLAVYGTKREYPKALMVFDKYFKRDGGIASEWAREMTRPLQQMNVFPKYFQENTQLLMHQAEYSGASEAFSFLVRIKAYERAQEYVQTLIQIGGEEWWRLGSQSWVELGECADMYEGLQELGTAVKYYQKAIDELEARRHSLVQDTLKTALAADIGVQSLYFKATRAALSLSDQTADKNDSQSLLSLAFHFAESGHARSLLDLMASSLAHAKGSSTESQEQRAWCELNAKITSWQGLLAQENGQDNPSQQRAARLRQRIETDAAALANIENELAKSNPGFYRMINPQIGVMTLKQVQQALPPGAVLLQYSYLSEDFLAWAILPDGRMQTCRRKLDAGKLDLQIKEFVKACMDRGNAGYRELGIALSDIFLKDFVDVLQGATHLFIVPYGSAHTLPFHVLPWEDKLLGESHAISYLPSASTLQFLNLNQAWKVPDSILAVGNPAHMAYRHPLTNEIIEANSLSAAENEAVFIASQFPHMQVLTDSHATESSVRALIPDFPLLHFATHGVLFEDVPLLSAILLAEGEMLNVYELMGMNLNKDLVVMSACQTALGEITGGNDVVGFTRGLLGSGVQAVVASLWSVDDLSTSLFMGEFYRQLLAGKSPAVGLQMAQKYLRGLNADSIQSETANLLAALQAAKARSVEPGMIESQVELRKIGPPGITQAYDNYKHPFYWAPFILVG